MKKIFLLFFILAALPACKKVKFSPEGPTDVRVKNISGLTYTEVTVNTTGGIHNFGTITPGDTSDYYRFDIAYPKAEISARINGVLFSTGKVDVTYMQYIGQDRITYLVEIENASLQRLAIKDVIQEEPLIIK